MEDVPVELRVKFVLNELAKEHGAECFVADGYGYYDDAKTIFTAMLQERENEIIRLRDLVNDYECQIREERNK